MQRFQANAVVASSCELGEGPLWDDAAEEVLWIDIPAEVVHAFSPRSGQHRIVDVPWRISCVVRAAEGGLVVAGDRGVWRAGADLQPTEQIAALPLVAGTRVNDGGCDPQGRLWIGSADASADAARGSLWRVSQHGDVQELRGGLSMSNGIGWTADGRRCFHVDTRAHALDLLELDGSGDPVAIERFADVDGMPDGLAVDVEGGVWLAVWDRAEVRRYSPDGTVDAVIAVDGGFVTSCAFGPAGSETLYITTASQADPDAGPQAGALFAAEIGVDGVPVGRFGGLPQPEHGSGG